MSKKSFDHIENKIRAAAENSEPDFDEFAWSKMQTLLDKEKDNKRRYIFWWILLPLLFIGGGGIYLFLKNKPDTKLAQHTEEQVPVIVKSIQSPDTTDDVPVLDKSVNDFRNKVNSDKTAAGITEKTINSESEYANSFSNNDKDFSNKNNTAVNTISKSQKIRGFKKGKLSSTISKGQAESSEDVSVVENVPQDPLYVTSINDTTGKNKDTSNKHNPVVINDSLAKKNITKNTEVSPLKNNTEKPTKPTPKNMARFYLLAGIGADAGNVKLLSLKNSKITAKYGIGIGYQVNKKISLQTGFYVSRKKYIAGPDDYKAQKGSYWSMVQIIKVGASCLVYDIPLTVRYNFLEKPTTLFYATAGVSSFIMKKEDYDYDYIHDNMWHKAAKSYTGNKTYLSVFNLSVGIEKKLSPAFSILAEPSVSLPIRGIGDGSIKLYSTALQVALKYQIR